MILIGETAKCLLGHSVQRCVKSRRWVCAHARNHVICQSCPKCLIAVVLVDVDLPYWTLNVEHVVAFTVIFSNICTARAQKRLFMNFSANLDTAIWFADPDFLLECTKFQRFGDVSRWFFLILYAECPPYFYFRFVWTTDPESTPHASTPTSIIPTKFEVATTTHCRVIGFLSANTARDLVTLTFDLLTLNSWRAW